MCLAVPWFDGCCMLLTGRRQRSIAECFRASGDSLGNSKGESEKEEPSTSGDNHTSSVLTFKRRKSRMSPSSQEKFGVSERAWATSATSTDSKDVQSEAQNSGRKLETVLFKRRSKEKKSTLEVSQDPYASENVDRLFNGGGAKRTNSNADDDAQDPFSFDDVDVDFKSRRTGLKRQRTGRERTGRSKLGRREQKTDVSHRLEAMEDDGAVLEDSDSVEVSAVSERSGPDGENPGSRQSTLLGDCLLSGVKVFYFFSRHPSPVTPVIMVDVTDCVLSIWL